MFYRAFYNSQPYADGVELLRGERQVIEVISVESEGKQNERLRS